METPKAGADAFRRLIPWIVPAACIACWTMASEAGLVPTYLLPHPGDIGRAGYAYVMGDAGSAPYAGRFLSDAGASLARVFAGFFIAALTGVPLGILSGRVEFVRELFSGSISAVRAVPGISWLPLALVWFGIGTKTTIFLVSLAAFFPIYLNTATGARRVNTRLLQAGAMMGTGRVRGTFAILIPCAMPQIITGLRLGLGISWAYLVLGELTGVPNGLGALIMDARMLGRIDIIIVGIIIIAGMGRTSDHILIVFLRACFKSARRAG